MLLQKVANRQDGTTVGLLLQVAFGGGVGQAVASELVRHQERLRATPVQVASAVVGDAWSILVLREAILLGTRRFVDFRESLGVNRATLVARLGSLVDAGLLARQPGNGKARAVYVPTVRAAGYLDVLLSMLEWGRNWEVRPSDGELLLVTHKPCGARLSTVPVCEWCSGPVNARSVLAERPTADLRRAPSKSTTRLPRLDQLERVHRCPIARCVSGIGDRWSVLVVQEAFFGLRRFDAFVQRLAIAPNILSDRLRRLCHRGILERPGAVGTTNRREYRLTEKGLDLYRVPATLRQWAMRSLGVNDQLQFSHRWCGRELTITVRCNHCGERVAPGTVHAQWADL